MTAGPWEHCVGSLGKPCKLANVRGGRHVDLAQSAGKQQGNIRKSCDYHSDSAGKPPGRFPSCCATTQGNRRKTVGNSNLQQQGVTR